MTTLVTFGEAMLRFSPPTDERLETTDELAVHVAGAESNVAVAASRLGIDACWTSRLPDVPPARKVTGELRRHGVDVAVDWTEDGRLGTYYLEAGEAPRGDDVVYDRDGAPIRDADPDDLATDRIANADAFHCSGITPALSETLAETTRTVIEDAQAAGTTTVFDVNYRSKLWDAETAGETLDTILPSVDLLVVAERDARTVLDVEGDPAHVAQALATEYDATVVLTLGAEGALALQGEEVYQQSTFPATDRHAVGTGDAFVGGLLSRYLEDGDLDAALEVGAATAALKRTVPGDLAVVSPEEVAAVLEGDRGGISR